MLAEGNPRFFGPGSNPYGRTLGQWTVLWWRWALSIPKPINPVVDNSGRYADVRQSNEVFFLAGKFGSSDMKYPSRRCKIPHGTSILLPVLNCEANPLEYPHLKDDEDLIEHVKRDIDGIITNECYINGNKASVLRIPSDPKIFQLDICQYNGLDVKNPGLTKASADGYWVFLQQLPRGSHHITFRGSCELGRLRSGADYLIDII